MMSYFFVAKWKPWCGALGAAEGVVSAVPPAANAKAAGASCCTAGWELAKSKPVVAGAGGLGTGTPLARGDGAGESKTIELSETTEAFR